MAASNAFDAVFILRHENGAWKVFVDKDTADGGKIAEQDFQAATPIGRPAGAGTP